MNMSFKLVNFDEFKHIYDDMLLQFPKEELKTYDEFRELIETAAEYQVYDIKVDDINVGYAIWFIDSEMKFLWLDYIAIYKDFHSCGYGSLAIKEFIKNYSTYKYSFFEIEKPLSEQAIKRQEFYERSGCKNTGMEYFFPNKYKKLEMDLIYYPISAHRPDNDYINLAIKKIHKIIHKI